MQYFQATGELCFHACLLMYRMYRRQVHVKLSWLGVGAWLDDAGSLGAAHSEAELCSSTWAHTQGPCQVMLLQPPYNLCSKACCLCFVPKQHTPSEAQSADAGHAFAFCHRACLFDCPANLTLTISSSSICFTQTMNAGHLVMTWWWMLCGWH